MYALCNTGKFQLSSLIDISSISRIRSDTIPAVTIQTNYCLLYASGYIALLSTTTFYKGQSFIHSRKT